MRVVTCDNNCGGDGWYVTETLERKICEKCTTENIRRKVERKIEKISDAHIDLYTTKIYPIHKTVTDAISTGGVWVFGETGKGKTHAVLYGLKEYLQRNYELSIERTRPGELRALWAGQFEEAEYRARLRQIARANVLFLDDADKFGKPTDRQAQEIYDLFETLRSNKTKLVCTANSTIKDFLSKMPDEFRETTKTRLTGQNGLVREVMYV